MNYETIMNLSDADFKNWAMAAKASDNPEFTPRQRLNIELRIAHMQKGYMRERFSR